MKIQVNGLVNVRKGISRFLNRLHWRILLPRNPKYLSLRTPMLQRITNGYATQHMPCKKPQCS
uniref:Uncharacterized protein n=1 Tax=Salmonella phage vB_STmST313_KE31 TaxID=3161181 RepID=A0AAU8GIF6_9CAUD